MNDLIDRRAAIDAVKNTDVVVLYHDTEPVEEAIEEAIEATKRSITTGIEGLPSAQPEYEPVKAEDFAKTMSENTLYGFMAWHGEALELMERHGFVICKKTM